MSLQPGMQIGDYQILRQLGAGGMGQVFQVRNVISDRIEAMKVLLPDLIGDPGLADRFLREIKVQAALEHPNIAGLRTAIRDGNQVFVSGMTGIKPGTQEIIDGGVSAQTRQTLENIRTSLLAAGSTMAEVGECTVFLVDMAEYAAMNAVYIEFFRVNPPARATLAVSALPRPAARVEIKCTARLAG